jgi:hypothetical protein
LQYAATCNKTTIRPASVPPPPSTTEQVKLMNERTIEVVSRGPRTGEPAATAAVNRRSPRIFRLPNGWYFNTREKVPLGPFASAEQTEAAIDDFLDFLQRAPIHVRQLFTGEHPPRRLGC